MRKTFPKYIAGLHSCQIKYFKMTPSKQYSHKNWNFLILIQTTLSNSLFQNAHICRINKNAGMKILPDNQWMGYIVKRNLWHRKTIWSVHPWSWFVPCLWSYGNQCYLLLHINQNELRPWNRSKTNCFKNTPQNSNLWVIINTQGL